jgi:hypothetical protein
MLREGVSKAERLDVDSGRTASNAAELEIGFEVAVVRGRRIERVEPGGPGHASTVYRGSRSALVEPVIARA